MQSSLRVKVGVDSKDKICSAPPVHYYWVGFWILEEEQPLSFPKTKKPTLFCIFHKYSINQLAQLCVTRWWNCVMVKLFIASNNQPSICNFVQGFASRRYFLQRVEWYSMKKINQSLGVIERERQVCNIYPCITTMLVGGWERRSARHCNFAKDAKRCWLLTLHFLQRLQ